jgi:hypothetical protein
MPQAPQTGMKPPEQALTTPESIPLVKQLSAKTF